MPVIDLNSPYFWGLLSRLGEAQTALPAALLAILILLRQADARPLALWWIGLLCVAVAITTASKLAFLGWGIGWPELDFTGISGHAMFASAIYPLLFATILSARARHTRCLIAFGAGYAFALLVGISRVVIDVHSLSEVIAGLLVGGLASVLVLVMARLPTVWIGPGLPIVVVLFLALMPAHAPASFTHSAVTRLSIYLSGNKEPYTRADMLRKKKLPVTVWHTVNRSIS